MGIPMKLKLNWGVFLKEDCGKKVRRVRERIGNKGVYE
jgi:hypothetical protein